MQHAGQISSIAQGPQASHHGTLDALRKITQYHRPRDIRRTCIQYEIVPDQYASAAEKAARILDKRGR